MPRQPKPFFRKQTKSWYFSTRGKQIPLGKEKDVAFEKFHELMALQPSEVSSHFSTLYELSQVYLDWVEANRAASTYSHNLHYIKSLLGQVGRTFKIGALRKHHLTKWIAANPSWGSTTTQNDAITIVQRMLNWAVEEGYIARSPIPNVKKPKRRSREVFYTEEQWRLICTEIGGGFLDLMTFIWETGCRPQEARLLEARHVHLRQDLCLFPESESKGEDQQRVIFLTDKAKKILRRLMRTYHKGPLFRNSRGNGWTADAVVCRNRRLSKKVGFGVIAYALRHSYATFGLMNGTDSVVLSELMGHKDPSMLAKVCQKLSKNPDFLRAEAQKVRRS